MHWKYMHPKRMESAGMFTLTKEFALSFILVAETRLGVPLNSYLI